jgi:hypothetical protein
MKLYRRRFLHLAAGVAALPAASRFAWAQTYPARPVRILIGYPPGGAGDIVARLISQWLSERFGQQFVIENRPGAAGIIATEAVVRAAPDGYALLFFTSTEVIRATFSDKLNFNFIRDIVPVAGINRQPLVMLVHPSFSAKTVPEFIANAKGNPGKLNMASAGNGSTNHVAGELFKMMTGVNMVHVPYRGGAPALTDLLGGQVNAPHPPKKVPMVCELSRCLLPAISIGEAQGKRRKEAFPGSRRMPRRSASHGRRCVFEGARFPATSLSWPLPEAMTDEALEPALSSRPSSSGRENITWDDRMARGTATLRPRSRCR